MITSWSSKRLVEGKSMVSLQFITHQTDRYTYFESALMALEGGCKWIQLRMKEAPYEEVEAVALQLKPLCKEKKRSYFWMITRTCQKAGSGRSASGQKRHADRSGTTITWRSIYYRRYGKYIRRCRTALPCRSGLPRIGPFRFTTTKKNLSPVLGLEGYAAILSQMKEANIELPVVAIGGITCEDIPAILETGVNGIALSGTILRAEDPAAETRKILNMKCIIK